MFKIDPKDTADRYDLSKFISKFGSNFFDVLDSDFLVRLTKVKNFGTYRVLIEEGRPDLLSENIYGSGYTQYWWILMILNNLRMPNDLKNGMLIKYINVTDLEDIYFTLVPSLDQPDQTTLVERLI